MHFIFYAPLTFFITAGLGFRDEGFEKNPPCRRGGGMMRAGGGGGWGGERGAAKLNWCLE